MKRSKKKLKYCLVSGDIELTRTSNISGICEYLGFAQPYLYQNKSRRIDSEGNMTFDYLGYNYTVLTLNQDEQ